MAIANKPTELTEQVLESVKTGEQAALDAVRKFIDTVDQALPRLGAAPSWRQQVIDSGLEMADGLVQAQYDFLRKRRALGWPVAGGVATRGEVEGT